MKNLLQYIIILFTICTSNLTEAQNGFPLDVKQAIISGNSEQLASFFSQNVELMIKNKEDVYSKAQAEHILKDFFDKNTPEDFIIEIDEQSDGIRYTIGNLSTSGGKYRVYLVFQKFKSKYLINRLNISEYN